MRGTPAAALATLLAVVGPVPVAAELDGSGCAGEIDAPAVTCLANRYAAVGLTIATVYTRTHEQLSPPERAALARSQEEWLGWRDWMCTHAPDLTRAEGQLRCLVDLSVRRVAYIKAAWGGTHAGTAGDYDDGIGGLLQLQRSDGAWLFKLVVVRSPFYHVGEVSGTVPAVSGRIEWSNDDAAEPCLLTFDFARSAVTVDEIECQSMRGMRAYFSGIYRRVR